MLEEETYVYITAKGRKYHLNIECPYIKGRNINKIPLGKANKMSSVGACCMCQKSIKKTEGNIKDDDKCQKNSKKTKNIKKNKEENMKEEEEMNNKNNVNIINNNVNENEFEIITNDEQFESKNCKNNIKDNDDDYPQNIKRVDKANKKDNEIPFLLSDYSEITSSDINSISSEKNNKNGEKQFNNKTKNNNSNNVNNFINELNNKEKEDIKDKEINNCKNEKNNDINFNNNKIKSIFDSINKEEDQKVTNEESQNSISNSIDSKEIQNEPLNSINYLKENLSVNNKNNINIINNINNGKIEPRKYLNWDKGDYKLLEETNETAKLLYLKNLLEINDQVNGNISILLENKDDCLISNSEQNMIIKGNFKFKFEVIPLNEIDKPIMISVGFEIDYTDETDQNVINMENKKLEYDKNIKMGAVYETLILMRHFYIYKSTNIVHVLLNISKGKFFVVGENELQKRNKKIYLNPDNTEICYVRSFNSILLSQIKCVRPIFKYNKNSLEIAIININGKTLKNNKNS